MNFKLTTQPDPDEITGDSLEQLLRYLEVLKDKNVVFYQVWVEQADGQRLGVFCNTECALVTWYNGDSGGADAYAPEYADSDEPQQFFLENGQRDEYSKSECIHKEKVLAALTEFCRTGERPKLLLWKDY